MSALLRRLSQSLRGQPGTTVISIFGWTPGLRPLVRGRVLRCGCLVGDYLSSNGDTIAIVDSRAATCRLPAHCVDRILLQDQPVAAAADVSQFRRCGDMPSLVKSCENRQTVPGSRARLTNQGGS
jgi:hypothetical protein